MIIVASAMLATITIAVAAESPPRNASSASAGAPSPRGSVSSSVSGEPPAPPVCCASSTTGTTNTVNSARYAGNVQRARRRSAGSTHSTTPTWNCRGRQNMAHAASRVVVTKFTPCSPSPDANAWGMRTPPGSSRNHAHTPTPTKASTFTTDSNAIASISPSWCSVAETRRVPNSTANSAMVSATPSAISRNQGTAGPAGAFVSTPMLADTPLYCSARYGIAAVSAITVTRAASERLRPKRDDSRSEIDVMLRARATVISRSMNGSANRKTSAGPR